MTRRTIFSFGLLFVGLACFGVCDAADQKPKTPQPQLQRMKFNNPGLVVDLAVGLWSWPLPIDMNGDGRVDMAVNEEDTPYNGVYVFTNPGGEAKLPVFKPGQRISKGVVNTEVSYIDGKPRVLTPGKEYPDFIHSGLSKPVNVPLDAKVHPKPVRANMWHYVDFDGDGKLDIIAGIGDWTDYGWDNAFDAQGNWLRGPLRGQIYVARNTGTNEKPHYEKPYRLTDAAGAPLETSGWPSPNFADWDGDGDLDILCGEFLTQFNYFENVGTRTKPVYKQSVRVPQEDGAPLAMEMMLVTPTAFDWDGDGDLDLFSGEENGRIAFMENTGKLKNNVPVFLAPIYLQQEADDLKAGALTTPFPVDWDGDGDWDIITGNSAGYIVFLENLSGPGVEQPRWAAPVRLQADGKTILIMAGEKGSIQGPAEVYFGYTVPTVTDWDGDGLLDIVANSIWGKIIWYKNIGTAKEPKLAAAQPVEVEWNGAQPNLAWGWLRPEGKQLLTQWRTTPVTVDWNKDGLVDLVMLDHEGYLALFLRKKDGDALKLMPPQRVFYGADGKPLRLNANKAGASGRRKLCVADLDGDGKLDFLINSTNANWLRQKEQRDGKWYFEDRGPIDSRRLAGHTSCPSVVDFDNNGTPDILVGAEDGHFYYRRNPCAAK